MNESILSERAPDPVGPYPHVKKVNNFLFLSGVGPRKKGSLKIPGVELDEEGNIDYKKLNEFSSNFLKENNIF